MPSKLKSEWERKNRDGYWPSWSAVTHTHFESVKPIELSIYSSFSLICSICTFVCVCGTNERLKQKTVNIFYIRQHEFHIMIDRASEKQKKKVPVEIVMRTRAHEWERAHLGRKRKDEMKNKNKNNRPVSPAQRSTNQRINEINERRHFIGVSNRLRNQHSFRTVQFFTYFYEYCCFSRSPIFTFLFCCFRFNFR